MEELQGHTDAIKRLEEQAARKDQKRRQFAARRTLWATANKQAALRDMKTRTSIVAATSAKRAADRTSNPNWAHAEERAAKKIRRAVHATVWYTSCSAWLFLRRLGDREPGLVALVHSFTFPVRLLRTNVKDAGVELTHAFVKTLDAYVYLVASSLHNHLPSEVQMHHPDFFLVTNTGASVVKLEGQGSVAAAATWGSIKAHRERYGNIEKVHSTDADGLDRNLRRQQLSSMVAKHYVELASGANGLQFGAVYGSRFQSLTDFSGYASHWRQALAGQQQVARSKAFRVRAHATRPRARASASHPRACCLRKINASDGLDKTYHFQDARAAACFLLGHEDIASGRCSLPTEKQMAKSPAGMAEAAVQGAGDASQEHRLPFYFAVRQGQDWAAIMLADADSAQGGWTDIVAAIKNGAVTDEDLQHDRARAVVEHAPRSPFLRIRFVDTCDVENGVRGGYVTHYSFDDPVSTAAFIRMHHNPGPEESRTLLQMLESEPEGGYMYDYHTRRGLAVDFSGDGSRLQTWEEGAESDDPDDDEGDVAGARADVWERVQAAFDTLTPEDVVAESVSILQVGGWRKELRARKAISLMRDGIVGALGLRAFNAYEKWQGCNLDVDEVLANYDGSLGHAYEDVDLLEFSSMFDAKKTVGEWCIMLNESCSDTYSHVMEDGQLQPWSGTKGEFLRLWVSWFQEYHEGEHDFDEFDGRVDWEALYLNEVAPTATSQGSNRQKRWEWIDGFPFAKQGGEGEDPYFPDVFYTLVETIEQSYLLAQEGDTA